MINLQIIFLNEYVNMEFMNREIEIYSFDGEIIDIDLSKCFSNHYVAYENMMGTGIINNIIQCYGGGDGDIMFTN